MNVEPGRKIRIAFGGGRWFPGTRAALEKEVTACMSGAVPVPGERIVAAIAPHAGYVYSGAIAGRVFAAIAEQAGRGQAPDCVVLLGLSHGGAFPGLALMSGDAMQTPLGEVALDGDSAAFLASQTSHIFHDYLPHRGEHSAENQVPFLQRALPGVPLTIGLIGDHDAGTMDAIVAALAALGREKQVLVIASSDMLHDPDYETVTRTDKMTLAMLEAVDTDGLLRTWNYEHQVLCGIQPVLAAMGFAREQGCNRGVVLQYRNSGDIDPTGRGSWVVGYGAVVFTAAAG